MYGTYICRACLSVRGCVRVRVSPCVCVGKFKDMFTKQDQTTQDKIVKTKRTTSWLTWPVDRRGMFTRGMFRHKAS